MIIQSESELILQGYEIYVTAIDFNLLKLDPQISKGFVTTGRYGWQRRPQ